MDKKNNNNRLSIVPTYFCLKCKREFMLVLSNLDYHFDEEKLSQGYTCIRCLNRSLDIVDKEQAEYMRMRYKEIDCELFEKLIGKSGKLDDIRTFD